MTPPDLHTLLPAETVLRHRIIPLSVRGSTFEVGVAKDPEAALLRDVAFLTGLQVLPVAVGEDEIDAYLEACGLGRRGTSMAGPALADPAQRKATSVLDHKDVPSWSQKGIVQQVQYLIQDAISHGSSDIHVEPLETGLRIRYRIDGMLHTAHTLPKKLQAPLLARLKIMSKLDIAEKRRPQDGRMRFQEAGAAVDIRLSTLPTHFGEKAVMRLLRQEGTDLSLAALGFESEDLKTLIQVLHRPCGMILVTGPTGSGKTTTLYAALHRLNTEGVNILTVEDPIEYHLPGVSQVQVHGEIGFTFARALRAFLRQDPDVIMVGEVRDAETAQVAIRAALTGHRVLSTLHTKDAPSALVRLIDMGIPPYLVASSVDLVVAQRLVRRICPSCKTPHTSKPAWVEPMGLQGQAYYHGSGCPACKGTGYKGRVALFEVMPVSISIQQQVTQQGTSSTLRRQAQAEGMNTLREAALVKVTSGVTSVEEVMREASV